VIEADDGEELEIYRRSTPWGTATEQGLNFVAFTNDLSIIETMLARMFGTAADGLQDRLLEFTTPLTGANYFVPSLDALYGVFTPN
jgi:putative iron-dependent peroxidase